MLILNLHLKIKDITYRDCPHAHTCTPTEFGKMIFRNLSINDVNNCLIPLDGIIEGNIPSLGNLKSEQFIDTYVHIVFKSYSIKLDTLVN